jgi:hypothetical protein
MQYETDLLGRCKDELDQEKAKMQALKMKA